MAGSDHSKSWLWWFRRMVILALLVQLLVMSILTLGGWGSVPAREVAAPHMERLGPPPGLIRTYLDVDHLTFPIELGTGQRIATAAAAGGPADWGGSNAHAPSIKPFGEDPIATARKLGAEISDTVLFVVPSEVTGDAPLYVVVAGHRYQLSLVQEDPELHFAIAATSVPDHALSAFGSSLLWLTEPVTKRIPIPLMLIRRDPVRQAYTLTSGVVGPASHEIATPVRGASLGTPVVAITTSPSASPFPAVAGFVERPGSGPTEFVPTSSIASVLRAVAPAISGGE